MCCLFFFFQAEDGIRDRDVTGVQTCALPILAVGLERAAGGGDDLWVRREPEVVVRAEVQDLAAGEDRKSTRLNSSHITISYAVFCLKKKKKKKNKKKTKINKQTKNTDTQWSC